ncbi:MAG: PhzF family phenazine biosynthesis protein [Steroidobacteraceae bacterium]
MGTHPFRIVNVFTRGKDSLTGNPLCVFENGAEFDDATMLALARQFNLSETTFLLPSTEADARVRIFTPSYEMPFAGHPTLGTAHVCRALRMGGDSVRLEMQAGVIPVDASGNRWTLTAPSPTWRELSTPVAMLARALSLDEKDIGERPLWIKAGTEQLIVPLTSEEAVRRISPQIAGCADIQNEQGVGMIYVFAMRGAEQTLARFFFAQGTAMLEDPATGSATANFGGWCVAMKRQLPLRFEISQGEMIGRPSSLYLDVGLDRHIKVSGDVLEIATGAVTLS